MHQLFRGSFFNFEAIRILGFTRSEGADIAECLEAVGQIRENDPVSWQAAWSAQAEWADQLARDAHGDGNKAAARGALLRAANYTRASAYMLTGSQMGQSDPRVVPILQRSARLFRSATQLLECIVYPLEVPYEDGEISLPAYLYYPNASSRLAGKVPLVINIIGADSTQEEQYFMFPAVGPDLGYAVLTFEGPGHGLILHEHGVAMRPDWEVVIGDVLDFVHKFVGDHAELDIDLERVAVAGASLGGYLALRAAADDRCKACIAIDPVYDLYDFGAKHVAPTFFGLWDRGWIPDSVVNGVISFGTKMSFQSRWEIFTAAGFLGAVTAVDLLRLMKKYTLREAHDANGSYLSRVQCPVLVTGAAKSVYFDVDDHTAMVLKGIRHEDKEVWVGLKPGQGGLQAKMGAVNLCCQRTFAFLDKRFGLDRKSA
ncbi:alpha/beta hydrolase [Seiridium cupressi]